MFPSVSTSTPFSEYVGAAGSVRVPSLQLSLTITPARAPDDTPMAANPIAAHAPNNARLRNDRRNCIFSLLLQWTYGRDALNPYSYPTEAPQPSGLRFTIADCSLGIAAAIALDLPAPGSPASNRHFHIQSDGLGRR